MNEDSETLPGAFCNIVIDGKRILFVEIHYVENPRDLDLKDLNRPPEGFENAAMRKPPLPGKAAVGSNGGVVWVKCDEPGALFTLSMYFGGDEVEDSPEGYKKLQRFLDEFTPKVAKKYGCTK
ncbi:hypothetical protein [Streptomyces palmae]|uniref:Uncharacterized protein n=1 Tax=Streptomyces palmae TaxID=1701085 RepID=A0A4Z0HEM3_9ACTN|nr:hypothetical protein [Streptomyces palmae]TGB17942.1 hypothetical protein E4099_02785 [Streptomyces palmae]